MGSMKAASNDLSPVAGLPALPASATTKDGAVFDPRPDEWIVANMHFGATRINFHQFKKLTGKAKHKLKLTLVRYLENSSFAHFQNIYFRFLAFYRTELADLTTSCDQISLPHLLNYKARQNAVTEWKLGILRILFLDMESFGYGVCSGKAVRFLRDSTIKSNIKGTSIRTRDPEAGAFSDTELLSIQSALNNAYASGDIELQAYAMAWLFLAYGARPIQIVALKEKDLVVSADSNGTRFYALRIPRAKQHGEGPRDSPR